MGQQILPTTNTAGETFYSNVLNDKTGLPSVYKAVTTFIDGTVMTLAKCDGVIYKKLLNGSYLCDADFINNRNIDVRRFGVKESNSDNKVQIDAAIAVANKIAAVLTDPNDNINLIFPNCNSAYKSSGGHIVQRKINVKMFGRIEDINPAEHICFTIGEVGKSNDQRRHHIQIRRSAITRTVWESENDIGCKIINDYFGNNQIQHLTGFSINLQLAGNNSGIAYCQYHLGYIENGWVNIDLHQYGTGWVNENTFYGGEIRMGSAGQSLNRIGVRITTDGAYNNNNNVFFHPSFEGYDTRTASFVRCIVNNGGQTNHFVKCRSEQNIYDGNPANSQPFVTEQGKADSNVYDLSFITSHVHIEQLGTSGLQSILKVNNGVTKNSIRTIFNSGNLAEKTWKVNTRTFIEGVSFTQRTSGNIIPYSTTTVVTDGRYINTFDAPSVNIDTGVLKRFAVAVNFKDENTFVGTGKIHIKVYDAAGVELISDANNTYTKGLEIRQTSFGGEYTKQSDMASEVSGLRFFSVSSAVKSVRLIVEASLLAGFIIYAFDKGEANIWSGISNTGIKPSNNTRVLSVSADYQILTSDEVINVEQLTANIELTLPLNSDPATLGKKFTIKGPANANSFIVTIRSTDSTISGSSTVVLNTPYESVTIYNKAGWEIMGGYKRWNVGAITAPNNTATIPISSVFSASAPATYTQSFDQSLATAMTDLQNKYNILQGRFEALVTLLNTRITR